MTRLDPQDVRQGRKGTPVLRVLVLGLVLCAVAAIIMVAYAYVMPDQTLPDASVGGGTSTSSSPSAPASPANSGSTTTPAQTGTTPAPASSTPSN